MIDPLNDKQNLLKRKSIVNYLLSGAIPIIFILFLVLSGIKLKPSGVDLYGIEFEPVTDIESTEQSLKITQTSYAIQETQSFFTSNKAEEFSIIVNENQQNPTDKIEPVIIDQEDTFQNSQNSSYNSFSLSLESNYEKLNVGSGIFENAYYSDGMENYDIQEYYRVQRIRREENSSGCEIADVFSEVVWVTGNKGAEIKVNQKIIGKLNINTGNHGYISDFSIKPGDEICITGENLNGFSLVFGPDVLFHYDSYCYRGFCE